MLIKRVLILSAAVAALGALPSAPAEGALLTSTFCVAASNPSGESSTCPTGLGATLTIDPYTTTAGDFNDYTVTLTLDTTAPNFNDGTYAYISDVQFSIGGASTGSAGTGYGDYEAAPSLTSAPDGTANWDVYFDTINGSVNSCTSDGNGTSTCAAADDPYRGAPTSGATPLQWTFLVDFDGESSGFEITGSTSTNLRATFLKPNRRVATILSPNWSTVPGGGGGGGGGTGDPAVPEPGTLVLLGTGFVMLANQVRHRSRRTKS